MTLNHPAGNPETNPIIEFPTSQAQLPAATPEVVQVSSGSTSKVHVGETSQASTASDADLSYHKFGFNKQDPQPTPTVTPLTFATVCVIVGGAVLISNPHIFKPRPIYEASAANTTNAVDVSQLSIGSNIPQPEPPESAETVSTNPSSKEQLSDPENRISETSAQPTDPGSQSKVTERPLSQFEVGLIQAARWTPPASVANQAIPPAPVPYNSFYVQRGLQTQQPQTQSQNTPQDQVSLPPTNQQAIQDQQIQANLLSQQQALAEKERFLAEQIALRDAQFQAQQLQAQQRQQALAQAQQQREQQIREQQIRQQLEWERLQQAERDAQIAQAQRDAMAQQQQPAPQPPQEVAVIPNNNRLTGLGFNVGARPNTGFTVSAFQRGTATDSCLAPNEKLTPLAPPTASKSSAPEDYTEATDSLTFFVHVPATDSTTAQFTFGEANSDKQLYSQTVPLTPNQAQVIGIQVPSYVAAKMAVDQSYLWQFALRCNENNGSNNPIARGVVVKQTADLNVPQSPTQKAAHYAKKGLWPDAVSAIAQLYKLTPSDTLVLNDLRSLFRTAGLPSFVNQAPVKIY